jgi:uncharacterized protein (TIGR01777 family)
MPVVLISGGSGLIGRNLTRHLTDRGYEVIILSRTKKTADNPLVTYSLWNVEKQVIDVEAIKKSDHIIHLAGAGVMDKKWTPEYQRQIVDSRVKSAQLLVKTLNENEHHIKTFVSATAIGFYGGDAKPLIRKEGFIETDLAANDFLGATCLLWEASTEPAAELGIRVVRLRTGIVLSERGGMFKELKKPLNFGVASIFGNGKQVVSWIHIDDLSRMYINAIEDQYLNGNYNAVAPCPVTQKEVMVKLGEKLRHKFYTPIHVPSFILQIIFGKRSVELLKSATVSNKKIKAAGFTFLYPTIEAALEELLSE